VNLAGQFVRVGRDDGAGFDGLVLAFRPAPPFPEPGDTERLATIDFVEKRLTVLSFAEPFVIAIGDD
jgi:hypothetical protein